MSEDRTTQDLLADCRAMRQEARATTDPEERAVLLAQVEVLRIELAKRGRGQFEMLIGIGSAAR